MSLREQLADDLKEAIRQKDERRKITLRLIIAGIQKAETELDAAGNRVHLDDAGIRDLMTRQTKQRQESIAVFRSVGRHDRAAEEEAELAILLSYLPHQLTRAEVEAEARQIIAELGASGPHDLGKVMKPLVARLKGRADGQLVNLVVREILSGQP